MKNLSKYLIFCLIISVFLSSCSIGGAQKITTSEYTKEVVIQNTKFNSSIDDLFDHIETYSGTDEANQRLNALIDSAISIIDYLKVLEPKIPQDNHKHYEQMMHAYEMYQDGLEIYRKNIPLELSNERNNNIKLAESKFEDAKNLLKNIE